MRLKPVPEGAPQHASVRARRTALHNEMLAIEEIRGIARIKGKRLEPIQGAEWRRRPFPAIAKEVQYAKCARACRMRVHWSGIPALVMKIPMMTFRRRIAPWIYSFAALRRAVGSAMPLSLRRQFFSCP